jgi:hypothetical protein
MGVGVYVGALVSVGKHVCWFRGNGFWRIGMSGRQGIDNVPRFAGGGCGCWVFGNWVKLVSITIFSGGFFWHLFCLSLYLFFFPFLSRFPSLFSLYI